MLVGGRGARLAGWSSWSGATQRGVLPQAGAAIDIAIPPERRVHLPGAVVHRVTVGEDEITVADGIPTHSMTRLLLDLAQHADGEILEWAWRQAIYKMELDIRAMASDVEYLLSDEQRDARYAALGYASQRYGWREARRERTRLVAELQNHRAVFSAGARNLTAVRRQ